MKDDDVIYTQPLEKMVKGIFIEELKNRFLCSVRIDNKLFECYVPSSCRLDNFINLYGKEVLLLPTQTPKSRTKYSLFAVPYKRNYILLNIGWVNKVIAQNIHRRYFSILGGRANGIREYNIEGYKCDIYLPDTKTIIEIKSVLSLDEKAVFPTIYSQRAEKQLSFLQQLMNNGYKAALVIVSLNPYVKSIQIDPMSWFNSALEPCIHEGIKLMGFSIDIDNEAVRIKRSIPIL